MKKRNAQIAAFIAAVTVSASFLPGCQKGKDASTYQAKMKSKTAKPGTARRSPPASMAAGKTKRRSEMILLSGIRIFPN